jgi:ParB-like chromosome segregation protein Spo0J
MKVDRSKDHQKEILIQHIPVGKIDIPSGQQKSGNPTARLASIQRVGLLQPILVTPRGSRYLVIDGRDRYYACASLGWATIPAIILWVDGQHAELIAIDANLMREERTPSERRELRRRRWELCGTIYRQHKHRNGLGAAHRKEREKEDSASAADIPSKMERTRLTILHSAPIDTDGHHGEGDDRGGSGDLAPLGSRARRAFIPRLITRLFGVQDTQQSPPWPVLANYRMAPSEVKPKGKPSNGQRNDGKTRKKA